MPITPHSGPLSASADVRVCVMGFVDDFARVLFLVVVPLRSPLGFSGRSMTGHINSMVFRLGFPLFFECSDRAVCLLCFIFYLCCPLECRVR